MGRRKSILGTFVREMEKSANRAAADRRRRERRLEGVQSRAIERELVRHEREQERARIRAEREAERRRITEERERALLQKQEAKDAQIRAWRLEYEEHNEREQEIERIANESPEVEDRDRLYAELLERRAFEPALFVAPTPPNSKAKAKKLHEQAEREVESQLTSFRPKVASVRRVQAVAWAVLAAGLALFFTEAMSDSSAPLATIFIGVVGIVVTQVVATRQANHQRDTFQARVEQEVNLRLQEALEVLTREDEAQAQAALQKARTTYETETEAAREEFDREEDERLRSLHQLQDGDTGRMREALEAALPLDLPVPCQVRFDVQSAHTISLELDVPEPSVIPTTEAKLLSSGKVTYKEKSEKRLREQYLRLVAGLAIRHASEALLNLPTCQVVELRAFRTALDPSIGRPTRRMVLELSVDYPTLAPMTMDGIDPLRALKHFSHRINVDRDRDLQPLGASIH
ncbi:hypothetical protein WME98_03180 [Sorangium sp. So ce296]|uniref:hypothetical protein n=1 Tax=Sorangium sp. So ce296 TaxID=3133296 RepID=UPI003F613639